MERPPGALATSALLMPELAMRFGTCIEYRHAMSEPTATQRVESVEYAEFRQRLADPSVAVVDVLPVTTFRHSHIAGAKNLPLAHVLELASDVLPDKQQEVVLYCAGFT